MNAKILVHRMIILFCLWLMSLSISVPVLAAEGLWSKIGPSPFGPISRVVVDPINDSILYAESQVGLYKSLDRGLTWANKNTGLSAPLTLLLISPSDSSLLFATIRETGATVTRLYRSTNGGDSWVTADLPVKANFIIPNPAFPGEFYALETGGQALYKSSNSGESWIRVGVTPAPGNLVFHKTIPGLMLLLTDEGKIYRSTNKGISWDIVSTSGLPVSSYSRVLVAIQDGFFICEGYHFYRSSDGAIWYPSEAGISANGPMRSTIIEAQGYLYSIAYSMVNPYISGGVRYDLYRSADSGQSWTKVAQLPHSASGLSASVQSAGVLYLGSSEAGYQTSTDGGLSWSSIIANRYLPQVVEKEKPFILTDDGATLFAGRFRSIDGGQTWGALTTKDGLATVTVAVLNPDQKHIYGYVDGSLVTNFDTTTVVDRCLVRSADDGASWSNAGELACANHGGELLQTRSTVIDSVVAFNAPESIYVFMTAHYYSFNVRNGGYSSTTSSIQSSVDGGLTWQYNAVFPPDVYRTIIDPHNTDISYRLTLSGVYKATHSNGPWVLSNAGLPDHKISSFVISPYDSRIIYVGYGCNSTLLCPGLYKSVDAGATWSVVPSNFPQYPINKISFDPVNAERLYVATDGAGILLSNDGGSTWASLNTGLADLAVSQIAASQSGLRLIAATTAGHFTYDVPSGGIVLPPAAHIFPSAIAGNGQATISFTPLTNNGGAAIVSYTVTSSPEGRTATGISSPITLSGLSNGTNYTFTVTVTDSVGTSSISSPSSAVIPDSSVLTGQTKPSPNSGGSAGAGSASVSNNDQGHWLFRSASGGFIPVTEHPKSPPFLPPGYVFPQGLFDFSASGNSVGATATLTLNFPQALPQGVVYWKYGPRNVGGVASWYQYPIASISADRKQITLTVTDAAFGDDDLTGNGTIAGLGGPGLLSSAPAASLTGPFAYITHVQSNYVSVIDLPTHKVVSTITVGQSPEALAIQADGLKVYVGNLTSNNISVIDAASLTPSNLIPVGFGPRGLAVAPNGSRLYVANNTSGTVSVINTATLEVLSTVKVESNPWGVAVTPDSDKIYVVNGGSSSVSVISANSNAVIKSIPVGSDPFGISIAPDGSKAYIANFGSDTVSVINTATDTVIANLAVDSGPFGLALSPDGTNLYVTTNANTVSVIATASNTLVKSIPVGNHPQGVSVTPDGSKIVVANYVGNSLSIVNAATNSVEATLPMANHPFAFGSFITPSSTNRTVAEFYNSQLDNYFITADANEAGQIDNGGAGPGWSRTGNTFKAGGSTAVCRFYGSMSPGPNSHFYTVNPTECADLKAQQASTPITQKRWNFESEDFFSTVPVSEVCPFGTTPVYRAYNNGFARGIDSNHRISSNSTAIQQVVARGWLNEGVVMCAPL